MSLVTRALAWLKKNKVTALAAAGGILVFLLILFIIRKATVVR